MAFWKISTLLGARIKKLGLKSFLEEDEVLNAVNVFLYNQAGLTEKEAKTVKFKNGNLTVFCYKGVISSEIKMRETEIRNFLKTIVPSAKIERFFYILN